MKKDNSVVDEKTFINADGIMFRSISLLFRSAPVLASLTFLLVAVASAVDADKIIVLSGGTVAEIGQHAELMAKNSLYRTMFDTQAEKYRT